MSIKIKKGATSQSIYLMLVDSAAGTPEVGYSPTGIDISYFRDRESVVGIDITGSPSSVSGDYVVNTAIELSSGCAPGLFRIDYPDAAFAADDNVDRVQLVAYGDGLAPAVLEVELIQYTESDLYNLITQISSGVNVTGWLNTACATPNVAGVPVIDILYISGEPVTVNTTLNDKIDVISGYTDNITGDCYDAINLYGAGTPTTGDIADAVWNELLSEHTVVGSAGYELDNIEISNDGSGFTAIPWNTAWNPYVTGNVYDGVNAYAEVNVPTLGQVVSGVWNEAMADHITGDSIGQTLYTISTGEISVNTGDIATAVWAVDTTSSMLSAISGYTDTLETAVADVPTVAEFNARTLQSGDYLAIGDLNNLSAADVSGQVAGALSAYDGPTYTELLTRTLQSGDYLAIGDLNNLSAADVSGQVVGALNEYDGPTYTEMTSAFTEIKGASWSSDTDTLHAIATGESTSATPAEIADAVWNETSTDHVTAGYAGYQLWNVMNQVSGDVVTVDGVVDGISTAVGALNDIDAADVSGQVAGALSEYGGATYTQMTGAFDEIKGASWSSDTDTLHAIATGEATVNASDIATAVWAVDTTSSMLSAISGYTDTLETAVADVPTVAEFNARTLQSGDYLAIGDLNNLSAADVSGQVAGALSEYGGATYTQMTGAFDEIKGINWAAPTDTLHAIATGESTVNASDIATAVWAVDTTSSMLTVISGYTDTLETAVANVPTVDEIRTEIDTNSTMLSAISGYTDTLETAVANVPTATEIREEMDASSTMLAAISGDVSTILSDLQDGGRLDLLIDQILTDISGLENLSAATVKAQVVSAISGDTYTEPGQGVPSVSTSLVNKVGYLYKALRNKNVLNSSTGKYQIYADDAATVDHQATVSDNGTITTRGELESG